MFKSATSPLTSCRESGKVVAPESTRCGNRLSVSPRDGKNIAAYSAVEAPIISDGQLSHIGGDTTSSNREDWRLRRAGERCNPAFSFNPKIDEVPMFKSATSPSSVPLCLRHGMKNSALYDAQYLAAFLQQVVSTIATDNGPLDEKAYLGCRLCFDLLRDKLAIAAGEMPDPEEGGNE